MTDINLSRWAINHGAVVLFMILASTIAGVVAYTTLGRA